MKPQILYIGGVGRSGSTLLAGLVGRLPGHVPVGELRYVWQRSMVENQLCGCGRPFRSCPFWTEVMETAFGGFEALRADEMASLASRVDRIRYIPALAVPALRSARFRADLEAIGDVLRRLYSAILSVSGGSVVVDSSKDPSYAYLLCAQPPLDVAVAHLVRDSRAVAYSWTREKVRPEIHWKVEYMRRRSPMLTARRWSQYNVLFELLGRRVRRFVRLRYEDVVRDPEAAVAAVAELSGAGGPPPATGLAAAAGAVTHTVAGNPMRFDGPRPVQADMEWAQEMPTDDRRLVTAVTAPLLFRYGYLGRRAAPAADPAVGSRPGGEGGAG